MASSSNINDFVRHRIRQLRKGKKMKVREIAERTALPTSSYASMESGFYKINLDNLFRILGALEVDIQEVWPTETTSVPATDTLYLRRIQQFRLGEVINLCDAEGAALFRLADGKCEVLLHQGLSDFLLDRLIFYVEDGIAYPEGCWFEKALGQNRYFFLLKAADCPSFVSKLVQKYMTIWMELYGES